MQKFKFKQRVLAVCLSLATVFTSALPSTAVMAASTTEPTVENTAEGEAPSKTNVTFRLPEKGGSLTISDSDGNVQTVRAIDEVVVEVKEDSVVNTEVNPYLGYDVASYKITSDAGDVVEDVDVSTLPKHSFVVPEGGAVVEIIFSENQSDYEITSPTGTTEMGTGFSNQDANTSVDEDIAQGSIDPGEDVGFNGEAGELEKWVNGEKVEANTAVNGVIRKAMQRSIGNQNGWGDVGATVYARIYNENRDTLSSAFGFDANNLFNTMKSQITTDYYLGTPYNGGDNRNPKGDPSYKGTDVNPGDVGMNCTGFIWHMLMKSGARVTGDGPGNNTDFVGNTAALQAQNANLSAGVQVPGESGWVAFLSSSTVEYKTYVSDSWDAMVRALISDDYWEVGDVIWTWDLKNPLGASGGGANNGKFPNAESAQDQIFNTGMYGHPASGLSWGSSSHNHILFYIGDAFSQYCTLGNPMMRYIDYSSPAITVWHSSDLQIVNGAVDLSKAENRIGALAPKEVGGPYAVTIIKTGVQPKASINVRKSSMRPDITENNSCYSLKGGIYEIYKDQAKTQLVATLTTDETGLSNTVEVEAGDYWVYEKQAPQGFQRNTGVYKFSVAAGETKTIDKSVIGTNSALDNQPKNDPGMIILRKRDQDGKVIKDLSDIPQGNASLAGAEYTFKFYGSDKVEGAPLKEMVLATNANGIINMRTVIKSELVSGDWFFEEDGIISFPIGTVTIQETKAPTGYKLDSTIYVGHVVDEGDSDRARFHIEGAINGNIIQSEQDATSTITHYEDSTFLGGLELTKFDANTELASPEGDATLAGAEFTIYNMSVNPVKKLDGTGVAANGEVVGVITTNENGYASTGASKLPYGDYKVVETKAPNGYLLNPFEASFSISTDGQMVTLNTINTGSKDMPIMGDVQVEKVDKELSAWNKLVNTVKTFFGAQGDGSLEGIEFNIVNKSTNPVKVEGKTYVKDAVVKTITTSYEGDKAVAKTTGNILPYGTYTIQEVKTNGSYLLTDGTPRTFAIRENGVTVEGTVDGTKMSFENNIKRGGVTIKKVDSVFGEDAKPMGDATLAGAKFAIRNDSANKVLVGDDVFEPGEICRYITTNESGIATTGEKVLPFGTYTITEVEPSDGYLLNEEWTQTFSITEDGQMVNYTDEATRVPEDVILGGVQVEKWDLELDKSEAIGGKDHKESMSGATLEGIEFEITNKSKNPVYVEGQEYAIDEVVKTVETEWREDAGAYVASTAERVLPYGTYEIQEVESNDGYLLSDGEPRTFRIRQDAVIVTEDTDGNDLVWKNQIVRGDVEFVKIADSSSKHLSVPFVITNVTTGEKHVIVTDRNGECSTSVDWVKHSKDTNGNDALLEYGEESIPASELKPLSGIWFGLGEDGSMADVDDSLCALPYGTYMCEELRCENNAGYELQSFAFTIYRNNRVVDLGTITDDATTVTIKTTALDSETKEHIAMAKEGAVIEDTVHCVNLAVGAEYTLKATLMDADRNTAVKIDGKKIEAEFTFTAESAVQDVVVPIELDASTLEGVTTVVFEDLYFDGRVIASHKDIGDEGQTVVFPKVETTLMDVKTDDHVGTVDEEVTLVDKVDYYGLVEGKEYTLKAVLMNEETGEPLLVNDEEIHGETTFTAESTDGAVEVEFTFDSSALAGATVVAFEDLYYGEILVGTHADIEDEDQTVRFPEIKTILMDVLTESHVGTVDEKIVLVDEVEYSNLVVDTEYTLSAVLMNKATDEPLLVNDEEVVGETTFTPTKSSGVVEVEFEFNSTDLEGTSVVAFEDLYHNDVLVGTHSDIEDDNQTVEFPEKVPELHTTALDRKTGIHEQQADEKAVIIDTVEYSDLYPGKEYTVSGILMDKATGESLKVNDKEVTAEVTFKPEKATGSVDLRYEFDSSALAGTTVVVFEDLIYRDRVVSSHADINDEAQSVNIIDIGTTALDKTSGSHTMTLGGEVVLVDTVKYTGLTVGKEYTLYGTLVERDLQKELAVNGDVLIASTKFTPEESDGEVEVIFTLNTEKLQGRNLVVFEELHDDKDVTVAEHKDITDEGQTVNIPVKVEEPEEPEVPMAPGTPFAKTGETVLYLVGAVLLVLMAGFMFASVYKRYKDTNK